MTVPMHAGDLPIGTLTSIEKAAGIKLRMTMRYPAVVAKEGKNLLQTSQPALGVGAFELGDCGCRALDAALRFGR